MPSLVVARIEMVLANSHLHVLSPLRSTAAPEAGDGIVLNLQA